MKLLLVIHSVRLRTSPLIPVAILFLSPVAGASDFSFRNVPEGNENPDLLENTCHMETALHEKSKLDEAEISQKWIVGIRSLLLGKEHPKTQISMMELTVTLLAKWKLDEAEGLAEQCLGIQRRVLGERHPVTLMSMMNVAIALKAKGKESVARSHYERLYPLLGQCAKERPQDVATRAMLASVCEKLDKLDECEREWKTVMELDPGFSRAYNDLAYAWIKRDINLKGAIKLVQKALELQPENWAYIHSLGRGYFKQGKLDEALSELQRALKANPYNVEAYEHIGDVYKAMRMPKEAVRHWKKALEIDPDNAKMKEKIEKSQPSFTPAQASGPAVPRRGER